jgi:hypothetical protein
VCGLYDQARAVERRYNRLSERFLSAATFFFSTAALSSCEMEAKKEKENKREGGGNGVY